MRSVEDAIERACAHCAAARTVMAGQKYNLHRRREGHTVGHCKGGLTLSLDLSRAFDCLPREVLHASLRFAQVDAELIDLILHIHRHSKLLIDHKDHRILVELHSGVRQGCSLSPALWSIFICYTLHLLSSRIPLEALTAFSDDILAQWMIDTPQDVLSAFKDMAFIIDTLTSLGMTVSDAKTVILDGLRGPQKSRLLKPLLKQHPDRGTCLQLACSHGFLDLSFSEFPHVSRHQAQLWPVRTAHPTTASEAGMVELQQTLHSTQVEAHTVATAPPALAGLCVYCHSLRSI